MSLHHKSHTDYYGFQQTTDYLLKEKTILHDKRISINKRDLIWVNYLKRIGGSEGIKPTGGKMFFLS